MYYYYYWAGLTTTTLSIHVPKQKKVKQFATSSVRLAMKKTSQAIQHNIIHYVISGAGNNGGGLSQTQSLYK